MESLDIKSITLSIDDGEDETWALGDPIRVNNPGHEDHDKPGMVVGFQILRVADEDLGDQQGVIYPIVMVAGGQSALFVIPYDRLTRVKVSDA